MRSSVCGNFVELSAGGTWRAEENFLHDRVAKFFQRGLFGLETLNWHFVSSVY